jgi:hypothetical protein
MNFDDAIKAHTYWKVMLRWMVNGERPVDPENTADSAICELGRWIHGDGRRYADLPAYTDLIRTHEEFHIIAASVIRCVQDGKKDLAHAMLANDGEFTLASARTIEAIRVLENQSKSGAAS